MDAPVVAAQTATAPAEWNVLDTVFEAVDSLIAVPFAHDTFFPLAAQLIDERQAADFEKIQRLLVLAVHGSRYYRHQVLLQLQLALVDSVRRDPRLWPSGKSADSMKITQLNHIQFNVHCFQTTWL